MRIEEKIWFRRIIFISAVFVSFFLMGQVERVKIPESDIPIKDLGLNKLEVKEARGGCGGGAKSKNQQSSEEIAENRCTRYPIVLAHGFSGWREIAGYEYFFGVKRYLEERLGCRVFVTQVDAFNTIEVRGNQLADQIIQITETGGFEKVNIIAHSMGGLDARYAITHRKLWNRIASLVTISTPHRGTSIADIAVGLMSSTNTDEIVDFILSLAGCTIDRQDFENCRQSALRAAEQLTTRYVQEVFNPTTPDAVTVSYFSFAGKTGFGSTDIVDPVLVLPYTVLFSIEGPNDGLCSVSSARWGEFLGTIDADHLDEIGQIAGVTGLFNHYRFYENIVLMLKERGF